MATTSQHSDSERRLETLARRLADSHWLGVEMLGISGDEIAIALNEQESLIAAMRGVYSPKEMSVCDSRGIPPAQ
ncbi:hypothetical protein P0D69_43475 [Paraburkholderia sediminicola]|uniref:hypothetical protein n=1 Tax=Paraburkholderia sediminicola TaxID=458836 RepID=UPI0038BAA657